MMLSGSQQLWAEIEALGLMLLSICWYGLSHKSLNAKLPVWFLI